jgi:hypothetical protein
MSIVLAIPVPDRIPSHDVSFPKSNSFPKSIDLADSESHHHSGESNASTVHFSSNGLDISNTIADIQIPNHSVWNGPGTWAGELHNHAMGNGGPHHHLLVVCTVLHLGGRCGGNGGEHRNQSTHCRDKRNR